MPAIQSWRTRYIEQLRGISLKQSLPDQSLAFCRRGKKELAGLLAYQAYQCNDEFGYPENLSQVDEVLREIVQDPYFSCLLDTTILDTTNQELNGKDFWQVKFSADGKMLAASNHDGSLRVWDVEQEGKSPKRIGYKEKAHDARQIQIFPGSNLDIAVVFSQDNQMLISSSRDGTIKLWDLHNLQGNNDNLQQIGSDIINPDKLLNPNNNTGFTSVSVIPRKDDKKFIAASNWAGNIWLWDITQPQQPKELSKLQRQLDWLTILQNWLDSLTSRLAQRFFRHNYPKSQPSSAWIWSIDISSDGNLLAAGGGDGMVYLWNIEDPQNPKLIRTLKGHWGEIFCVAFAPNGKLLASASKDCTIHLWQLDRIKVYIYNPLKKVLKGHKEAIRAINFSLHKPNLDSNNKTHRNSINLASASEDQTIRVWNLENVKEAPQVLYGHSYGVSSVVFAPNNYQRLVSCSWDRTIRFWTLGANPKICLSKENFVWDQIVKFLNLGAKSNIFKPRRKKVIAVTWIDESLFVLVTSDGNLEVRECDDPTNLTQSLASCSVSQGISTVTFFGEGKQKKLAVGYTDGSIWIWELDFQYVKQRNQEGKILLSKKNCLKHHQKRKITSLAFSADGQFLAAGLEYYNLKFTEELKYDSQTIKVWDLNQHKQSYIITPDNLHNQPVNSVVFKPYVSSDELILAVAYTSGEIYLYNLKTKKLLTEPPLKHEKIYGETEPPIILAFSPNGKWLVSGSARQYLLLWDISQLDSRIPQAIPPKLSESETRHSKSESKLNFCITALAFKDNQWLASGRYDGSIELWNLENIETQDSDNANNAPFVLLGHQEKINTIAFSPDKKQLASASFDNTVRLWTVETKELAEQLRKKLYRDLTEQEQKKFIGSAKSSSIRD
nr:hypothetical protein [Scytonema sp. UIC 10036]